MNKYYVYIYLRLDGTPYYVGKGSGKRIFKTTRTVPIPADEFIQIYADNLSEEDAFFLEVGLIARYGRADRGQGILLNKADGGQGCGNWVATVEQRDKISKALKGKPKPEGTGARISAMHKGRKPWNKGLRIPLTPEQLEEHHKVHKGVAWFKGKKHSEETKQKIRESRKRYFNKMSQGL